MLFRYVAYGANGNIVRGTLDVESERAAEERLWQQELIIVSLHPEKRPFSGRTIKLPVFGTRRGPLRVSQPDMAPLSRQLAALLDAGLDLAPALDLLAQQARKQSVKMLLQTLSQRVGDGAPLADALDSMPGAFPPDHVAIVRASENAGRLGSALRGLADSLDERQALASRRLAALGFPALMLALGAALTLMFVLFVPPLADSALEASNRETSGSLRLLLTANWLLRGVGLPLLVALIITAVAIVVGATVARRRSPSMAAKLNTLSLRLPVIGGIVSNDALSQMGLTLSRLLEAGVPPAKALGVLADVAPNHAFREAAQAASSRAAQGAPLSRALEPEGLFPRLFCEMVRAGEERGNLASTLVSVAGMHESEAQRGLARVARWLELAAVLLLGIVAAIAALALT